ncbi:MAG: 1-acyl-sn-glycerol-3-phosphate acyltransferase [Flavobacteriales bacterium]|nr:1-acyl-sn-glycerol-3-phosphate acyltransferase [Flavobacteriales bacterium]
MNSVYFASAMLAGIFHVIYKIWFALIFMAIGIVFYPFAWLLVRLKFTRTLFFLQTYFWWPLLQLFLFYPIKRIKKQGFYFPEGPFVLVANHQSYLDILAIFSLMRGRVFFFLGKESLKKFPIIGLFFKAPHLHVPIIRENKSDSSQSLKIIASRIDDGFPIVIFPEGTQSKMAPVMNPFKAGAFKVAIEKQVPVVPITFLNNYKLLSKVNKLTGPTRPGIMKVVCHPPISTRGMVLDDLLSLQEKVQLLIEQDLREAYPKLYLK